MAIRTGPWDLRGAALHGVIESGDGTRTWTDNGTDPDMAGQAPGDVEKRFYKVGVE